MDEFLAAAAELLTMVSALLAAGFILFITVGMWVIGWATFFEWWGIL